MRIFLRSLLTICLFIQSLHLDSYLFLSSTRTFAEDDGLSRRDQKKAERLKKEFNTAKQDDGSFKYSYGGEGSEDHKGADKVRMAFEQTTLFVIMLLVIGRASNCKKALESYASINANLKYPYKCFGWGTIAEMIGAAALLAGEITQSVIVQKAIKKELGKKGKNYDNTDSIVDHVLNGGSISEITGATSEYSNCNQLKDQGFTQEQFEEGKEQCQNQIRPLKTVKRILEAQLRAIKIKKYIYTTAFSTFTLAVITELVGAIRRKKEILTEVTLANKMLAEATTLGSTGEPCKNATIAYKDACAQMEFKFEAKEYLPEPSSKSSFTLIPTNKFCEELTKKAQSICATTPTAPALNAHYIDRRSIGFTGHHGVMPIPDDLNCSVADPYFCLIKDIKKGLYTFFDISLPLIKAQTHSERKNTKLDNLQLNRLIRSIAFSGFGGFYGYAIFKKATDKVMDAWYFSGYKRAILHGAEAALVGGNIVFAIGLQRRLETEIAEISTYLKKIEISLGEQLVTESTKLMPSSGTRRDFEKLYKKSYEDAFKNNGAPCPMGADGKGGCLEVSSTMSGIIGGLDLDGVVGQTSSDISRYADLTAGDSTLSDKALALGQKIFAAKAPLEKIKKKLIKQFNDMRMEDGQAPVDFEKMSAKVLKTIKDKFIESGGKGFDTSLASLNPVKKNEGQNVIKKTKKVFGKKEKKKDAADATSGFDFSFQKEKMKDISDGNVVDGTDVNKYGIGNADITKKSGTDIFKIITTRYFKTAFPVLLEGNP